MRIDLNSGLVPIGRHRAVGGQYLRFPNLVRGFLYAGQDGRPVRATGIGLYDVRSGGGL